MENCAQGVTVGRPDDTLASGRTGEPALVRISL